MLQQNQQTDGLSDQLLSNCGGSGDQVDSYAHHTCMVPVEASQQISSQQASSQQTSSQQTSSQQTSSQQASSQQTSSQSTSSQQATGDVAGPQVLAH